eukprot:4236055-Pyramimonas_sp.AAC.1
MVVVKVEPDIITYGTLKRSCEKCEKSGRLQCEQAVAPLSEMVVVKLTPGIITCDILNNSCEKGGRWQWQRAVALLSEMVA